MTMTVDESRLAAELFIKQLTVKQVLTIAAVVLMAQRHRDAAVTAADYETRAAYVEACLNFLSGVLAMAGCQPGMTLTGVVERQRVTVNLLPEWAWALEVTGMPFNDAL